MFKVEQEFSYGWDHAPWSEDLFDTYDEAQAAIDQLLADVKKTAAKNDMIEKYNPAHYRIMPIYDVPINAFSTDELMLILEAARIAMTDDDIADCIISSLDIDSDTFFKLTERLQRVMGDPKVEVDY